jgi:hypothetical protein
MNDWRQEHGKVMSTFLGYLNYYSKDFILKGGTALFYCYDLDRFSEDIDLDGLSQDLDVIVQTFCGFNGYSYRIAKDTDTVKRYMIYYGNDSKPLKIEASFRRKSISDVEIKCINGIRTYDINTLCIMKSNAYSSRDKLRDLYDISFICNNYFDSLTPQTLSLLRSAIEFKGIEQFDFIVKDQPDDLINENKLAGDLLAMYDKLGLLYDDKERQIMESYDIGVRPERERPAPASMKEQLAAATEEAKRREELMTGPD